MDAFEWSEGDEVMTQYPVILIPNEIQAVKPTYIPPPSLTKPSPPAPPKQPAPPPKEPQPINLNNVLMIGGVGLAVSLIGFLMFAIVSLQWGFFIGSGVFFLSVIAIALKIFIDYKSFPRRYRNYERLQQAYLQRLAAFSQDEALYEQRKQQYQEALRANTEAQQNWEQQVKESQAPLLEALSYTDSYEGDNSTAPKGQSEARFERYLREYFHHKIHTGLTLQNPQYSKDYPYTPDFVYIDKQTNLHIDIEVDEPYSYKSRQPLHYIGLETEETRDEFFLNRLWVIIRFTEQQVVKYPRSCCKVVAQVISDITGLPIHPKLELVSELKPEERWTEDEAVQMAEQNYRERYLKSK